jgi:hypothetical protein
MTTIAIATGEHFANSINFAEIPIRVIFALTPAELTKTLAFIETHSEPAPGERSPAGLVTLLDTMEYALRANGYGYKD